MGIISLLKKYIDLRSRRKGWRVEKRLRFEIDKDYMFSFLPTVIWMPWMYRYPESSVIDIWWLNLHITFGTWKRNEVSKGVKNYGD